MIKLRYVAASGDSSGYGFASRNYILALLNSGEIELSVKPVSFEREKTTHGTSYDQIAGLIDKPLNPDIQIIHLTPENYPMYRDPKAYNIGYVVWETDVLPQGWRELINTMDEVWTASEWNCEVFKKNGITKPIIKIPHGFSELNLTDAPKLSVSIPEEFFKFYSIFQWIERKHPLGLLKAFLTEFLPEEKVCLILKTYRLNTSSDEQDKIKKDIQILKVALNLHQYPPIYFFGNLMTAEQIISLHKEGDCYVSPTRGEAFGQTFSEAMLAGKPVIGSRYGGNLDFMNDTNSFLIDCQTTPCCGMIFPNYNGRMTWAEPDITQLRQLMRQVYTDREEAAKRALQGQITIAKDYNWNKIGQLMISRLKQIKGVV